MLTFSVRFDFASVTEAGPVVEADPVVELVETSRATGEGVGAAGSDSSGLMPKRYVTLAIRSESESCCATLLLAYRCGELGLGREPFGAGGVRAGGRASTGG